jgi:hypothetical protein
MKIKGGIRMERVSRTIIRYLSIRKTIAIALTLLFMFMAVKGRIDSEQVTAIYGVIIGFYFGRSTALDVPGATKEKGIDTEQ